MEAVLLFPHHLFADHPGFCKKRLICFIEHSLFFFDEEYPARFHKQKLVFHRSSMRHFEETLKNLGYKTAYIEASKASCLKKELLKLRSSAFWVAEFDDYTLEKRITNIAKDLKTPLNILPSPSFLTPLSEFFSLFKNKKHYLFQTFYIHQRKKLGILVDGNLKPEGGKWSFDTENRRKPPKGIKYPLLLQTNKNAFVEEAIEYVQKHYPDHPGNLTDFIYPICHKESRKQLRRFIDNSLALFGDYEDAILQKERVLFHSVLSPLLNAGLLTPKEVIEETLKSSKHGKIPLNSLEGFIRQVIGWREFIRGIYHLNGVKQRNSNFFHHKRKIPISFYEGTTGIPPIDDAIKKLNNYAYVHHIERLMVLGGFFLVCEIDPHEIYRWFMEMFIDSYDWVMVPNVYGMSQYADGGLMTTKPYFSGSNYILKMSDYKKADWTGTWDALFWRFMIKHLPFFQTQPRLNVLCTMAESKRGDHSILKKAENFLRELHK